jgi:Family of unknown function (DUF5641)
MVLLKDETAASCTYKLARIMEVLPDEKDDKVRKVVMAYKNYIEKVVRKSTLPTIYTVVFNVQA